MSRVPRRPAQGRAARSDAVPALRSPRLIWLVPPDKLEVAQDDVMFRRAGNAPDVFVERQ